MAASEQKFGKECAADDGRFDERLIGRCIKKNFRKNKKSKRSRIFNGVVKSYESYVSL
jgi:hypothetical protein